jgi:hypothetical protein
MDSSITVTAIISSCSSPIHGDPRAEEQEVAGKDTGKKE